MNRWFAASAILLSLAMRLSPAAESATATAPAAGSDRGEFRAVWVTRFEWTDANPEACKARIVQAFETIAAGNLNAAVFQIRGEAETLYPSTLEPWSDLLDGRDPGFDPVALAISEAHKRGIQFHAYINAMPLRSLRTRGQPKDPKHLWYSHGPDSAEPWVCMGADGRPARSEYYYLSAGVPGVHAYLRSVIMDVVRRYEVDGIHLDRIRFPDPEYIHDPVSDLRFYGRGNPTLRDREDWQRSQLDKFINDLAAEIRAVKPNCVLSCSAWGIYNRYHIPGYGGFSSGYHDYYQDTWNWCRIGAMDLLMPMIYWNIPNPKPNYDEVLKDFVRGVGGEHVVGGQSVFSADENLAEVKVSREEGAAGTVLFSLSSARRRGVLPRLKETLYATTAVVPRPARVAEPKTGCILGTVTTDAGKPLVDAWVTLLASDEGGPRWRRRDGAARTWTSGADGRFAFLNVPPGTAKVRVHYVGAPPVEASVEVKAGEVARVDAVVAGGELARNLPFLQILDPAGRYETAGEVVHILGRTTPDCRVSVGDKPVEVYSTGAFARDGIRLAMGENRIRVTAADKAGQSASQELIVVRQQPPAPAVVTDLQVIEPAESVALLPGEVLSIRATAPPGGSGFAACEGVFAKLPLLEEKDAKGAPSGVYTAAVHVPAQPTTRPAAVQVNIQRPGAASPVEAKSNGTVEVWDKTAVQVGQAAEDGVGITFGLHTVRLGGPYLGRIPRGTRFEIVGRQGNDLKVSLAGSLCGWVPRREVALLPVGTPAPRNFFTSCDVDGDDKYDRVTIALREKVVFAVRSETEPSSRLYVDFFNTHHAATWISHKSGARIAGPVTGEQVEDGWFRLTVPLRERQNWGYWTELDGNTLKLFIRRPPRVAAPPDSPLKGLLFALEAGHGGGDGAVGYMGTKEKTINAAAVRELKGVLESRGARTVLVRPGDSSPTLQERVDRANAAGADFLVSIHANAAGHARGYLSVSGTSTYYKDKHCHLPADLVYRKLLELGWGEFGVVGNFSYYPLQNTRMPAILVEQAFMSNPADEAKLLDTTYQRKQAEAIAKGLEEFFAGAGELPKSASSAPG